MKDDIVKLLVHTSCGCMCVDEYGDEKFVYLPIEARGKGQRTDK